MKKTLFFLCVTGILLTYTVSIRAQGIYDDNFWIAMPGAGEIDPAFSGGSTGDPGENGAWFFYPNDGGQNPWWNIWFYNGDFIPVNTKRIHMGFWVTKLDLTPGIPGLLYIVTNWPSPQWSWPPTPPPQPPLPPLTPGEEDLYVMRSELPFPIDLNNPGITNIYNLAQGYLYINTDPTFEPYIWIEYYWEIDDYNPDFISVDLWGSNFIIPNMMLPPPPIPVPPLPQVPPPFLDPTLFIPYWNPLIGGLVLHECLEPNSEDFYEFGDAPDGSLAYINGTIGNFPTCIWTGLPGDYISHQCPGEFSLFFGGLVDCEGDGNAGWCPVFNPDQYNMDECGTYPYPPDPLQLIDEGLMIPIPLTIVGLIGSENYQPCGPQSLPLEKVCAVANWGTDIDIWVDASGFEQGSDAYFHLLIDWNQDGDWANDPSTTCGTTAVPELVILNHPVPGGYRGPISAMVVPPPDFTVGPNAGYVWARFTLTERQVPTDWDGAGQFSSGETEDYILQISPDVMGTPINTWSVLLSIGLIVFATAYFIRRRAI